METWFIVCAGVAIAKDMANETFVQDYIEQQLIDQCMTTEFSGINNGPRTMKHVSYKCMLFTLSYFATMHLQHKVSQQLKCLDKRGGGTTPPASLCSLTSQFILLQWTHKLFSDF